MLATAVTRKTTPKTKSPREVSLLSQAGDAAKDREERALLLKTLGEQGWNLTYTAEVLGMKPPSVIRALRRLAPEEYECARLDGRIAPGARSSDSSE